MSDLPEACYRISAKALIFDAEGRLLVAVNREGGWEIPGGGWEHVETFDECIRRELHEELRATATSIGEIRFAYRGTNNNGSPKMSLAALVTVQDHTFTPTDDDLVGTRFVTKAEFLQLPFQKTEAPVRDCVDKIWPPVEKDGANR